ncbi:MAG: hypothetical protein DRJ09_11470 [Bacteroidetes bacterium]|nr:MAG: hypothetical protein DRJ09_11470 [Bacteroidota bacterium]
MKRGYQWFSVAFVFLGLVSIGYYFVAGNSNTQYGEELIAKAAQPLKLNLNDFLNNAQKAITHFDREVAGSNFSEFNPAVFDTLSNKVVSSNNYLRGLVLFTNNLKYVFLKDDNTRITTFTPKNDSLLIWKRLDKNLHEVSEWTDTYNFFLNNENRQLLESVPENNGGVSWVKINSEIPGRRELILQIHQIETKDNTKLFVAYVFQTSDFSGFFLKKLSMKQPVVCILTTHDVLFTPISTRDSASVKNIANIEIELKKIFNTWIETSNREPRSFSFELNHRIYWSRVDSVPNEMGIKGFSLTVSKENLIGFYQQVTDIFLYIGAVLILLGLLLWWVIRVRSGRFLKEQEESFEKLDESGVAILIEQGESEEVEYKSSLRYDYRQEKENKALEDVIIKSIAAFSNAKGGTLLIGVDDDQNILGLENDFSTLKKADIDYFELHLRKLIKNQFGINFSNHRLIIQFPEFDGKQICVIQITKAKKPIYIKVKNKQGQVVEKFYVRSGNSSQEITSLKEMEEYIHNRFKNNH